MKTATIANIVSRVQTYGYDGVGLDFEAIDARLKNDFTEFVGELNPSLKAVGKKLGVYVSHPRFSDAGLLIAAGWMAVLDYPGLAKTATCLSCHWMRQVR